jgi:hypothetical protein
MGAMGRQDKLLLALGVFGSQSRLSGRIGALLAHGRTVSLRASLLGVAAASTMLFALATAASRSPRWIVFAQQASQFFAFEAVSVKLHDPADARRPVFHFSPGPVYRDWYPATLPRRQGLRLAAAIHTADRRPGLDQFPVVRHRGLA